MGTVTRTLGGDRLGSGKKMKLYMRNYERSTHDLSYIWRSTMASGTLVPFLKQVALPGDTFDINLNANVMTLPTVGPLFGSFKLQLDVFMIPMRLYNRQLHMNKIGVGYEMNKVKFPLLRLWTNKLSNQSALPIEQQQINQSSLIAYLGIRGNGHSQDSYTYVYRDYNLMPILAYWDIYKNYYANKQEGVGYYIVPDTQTTIEKFYVDSVDIGTPWQAVYLGDTTSIGVKCDRPFEPNDLIFSINSGQEYLSGLDLYNDYSYDEANNIITFSNPKSSRLTDEISVITVNPLYSTKNVALKSFSLENVDTMREYILSKDNSSPLMLSATNAGSSPVTLASLTPYCDIAKVVDQTNYISWNRWSMNGIGLKTYQSDIFNNWIKNEVIDNTDGTSINEISSVAVTGGKFTIDALNLAKKVYDLLNRVAASGGTYEDWIESVYTNNAYGRVESPVYMGGLSKEVVFQEVVSNNAFEYQGEENPLGTLSGRGTLSQKHKGGNIYVKVTEPSYIMGIISLTPRIDYSQGIDWDVVNLKTMNDLHKPALDGIGFQDLTTWHMAFWEQHGTVSNPIEYSAGKQPAWINYMTNFNRCYGNFANPDDQMFMTLNRRYECNTSTWRIKDLTTYIDPKKFNYIFADTQRDAQNFWVQLACDITARRKMSAKIIPNL